MLSAILKLTRKLTTQLTTQLIVGLAGLVALFCLHTSTAFAAAVTWDGGGGDLKWETATNWNGDACPTSSDTVTINNAAVVFTSGGGCATMDFSTLTIGSGSTTSVTLVGNIGTGGSITIANLGTLKQKNTTQQTISGTLTIQSGGILNHTDNSTAQSYVVNIQAATIDLQSGSTVTADSLGYDGGAEAANGKGPDGGFGLGDADDYPGGGAHAGSGHVGYGATGNAGGTAYCTINNVATMGSGGGGGATGGGVGGAGGGLIILAATGTATLNGTITADGQNAPGTYSSGGAGGGIKITANTIAGTPTSLTATGGNVGTAIRGGAGGGGCIQFTYTTSNSVSASAFHSSTDMTVSGGTGFMGGPGTFFVKDTDNTNGDISSKHSGTPITSSVTTNFSNLTFDNAYFSSAKLNMSSVTVNTSATMDSATDITVSSSNSFTLGTGVTSISVTGTGPTITVNGTFNATGLGDYSSITLSVANGATWGNAGTITTNSSSSITLASGATVSNAISSLSSAGTLGLNQGAPVSITDLTITAGTTTLTGYTTALPLALGGTLSITGGTLKHADNSTAQTNIINVTATTISVGASGTISADYLGYDGGAEAANGKGPAGGFGIGTAGDYPGGGAHGGNGATGTGGVNAGGTAYCTINNVATMGSGGGGGATGGGVGGAGGGLILLTATGTATISGTITADGQNTPGTYASGGGGGGVKITADTIAGTPASFTATGGNSTASRGGAGGGGCVQVVYTVSTSISSATVTKGTGVTTGAGDGLFGSSQPATITLAVNNANIAEAAGVATFTATASTTSASDMTVNFSFSGTATGGGTDYTGSGTSCTITAGGTTCTVTATAAQDTLDEAGETVIVDISSVTNGTESGTQQQTTTITDDDATPSLTIDDVTVTEGTSATFTATLSAASGQQVTVDYATSNGTATAGSDYTSASGTFTFAAGETTKTVSVTTSDDALDEAAETYTVTLSNPSSTATISDATGTGTLNDNDASPTLSINDISVAEDGTIGTLTVTQSAVSGRDVTVDYTTSNDTATSGSDYTAAGPQTITISAGSTTQTFGISITNDSLDEDDETFTAGLTNAVNATISDASGTATITDNDAAPSVAWTADSQSSFDEGTFTTTMTATAQLSAASGKTVTVPFTVTGSAGSGTDYTITASPISIAAGATTATATVTIVSDSLDEDNETVILTIGSPTNASQGATLVHTATIFDDDAEPSFSIDDVTVTEGMSATFTATLSAASGKTVTVDYATSNSSATAGSDYTSASGTLTFSAGDTTKTFSVTTADDSLDEAAETYTSTLSNAANASISDATGTGTLNDNDAAPSVTLSLADSPFAENAGVATATATLSAVSGQNVTVDLAFSGTATNVTDYTRSASSITINAGASTGSVTVTGVNDSSDEVNETVVMDIDSVTNGTESGTQQVSASITDDDTSAVTLTQTDGSTTATEGGPSPDTYTVVLATQPTGDVTVTLAVDADVSIDQSTLTFTAANWDTAQTITVTAVNDDIAESNHTGTITHTAASSDANYNGISISNISTSITDNDSAGVSVTASGGSTNITEGSTTDDYTMVLTSEPTADVTITPTAAADCTVSPSSLTFTATNWDGPAQTFTITAVNDSEAEGSHSCSITHAATSADSNYSGLSVNSITATVTDNDSAGVTIAELGGSTTVTTSGTTDTYTVVLTSQPTATVTITPSAGAGLSVSPSSLTFTTANWNDPPQTITVSENGASESVAATITHAASSSDTAYNGSNITIASVTVTITDDAEDESDDSEDSEDGDDDACGSTLPQANAGGDGTLKVEQSTTLDGSSSTGSSLTYAWSISSGSGSLTNQTTSSPTFTAPSLAGSSVVSLTVTDCNNNTSTDTVTLRSVANSANSQAAEKEFVLVNDDGTVSETVRDGQVTLTVTYQGNSFKVKFSEAISENYNALMTAEGVFAVCLPQALDTRGVCYLASSNASSLSGTYDLNATEVDGFVSISGPQSGDRLGEYMGVNLDEDEIYLVAPGSGANGEARIYDLNANLIGIILGKDGLSICSVLFSNYLEVNAESVSLGPCNIAQNEGLAQIDAAQSSLSLMKGLLEETALTAFVASSSLENGDGTFDLNNDEADAELNCTARSTAFGDVNGDGNDDYLICGASTSYVFFGPYDNADTCEDADMVISSNVSDGGFCSSVTMGDVTEDGVDDIVIGGTDKLYIIFGSTNSAASIVIETSPSAMTIESADAGADVQIVDNIIYSSNGRMYSLQTLQEEEADAGANSLSAAGCQLDISKNHKIIHPSCLVLFLASMSFVAVLRKRGKKVSR